MQSKAFRQWLEQLPELNEAQKEMVQAALAPASERERVAQRIAQANDATRCCPDCRCTRWYRHGQAQGLQRYRCRQCGRTYNDLSNTPLAGMRLREHWQTYLGTMLDGKSIRKAAAQTGVHRNTSFRWRHRFAQQLAQEQLGACGQFLGTVTGQAGPPASAPALSPGEKKPRRSAV